MYTRHIYRIDEVKSALQYSIHNKRIDESIFWTKELYDSDEFDILTEVLFSSWFYSIGIGNLEILEKILNTNIQDEDELLKLVYAMTLLKDSMRDCTLPIVFLTGLTNINSSAHNVYFDMPELLKQDNSKIDTFIRTTLLGKYISAWKQFINLDQENIELLKNICVIKHNKNILEIIEQLCTLETVNSLYIKCAIICILCTNKTVLEKSNGGIREIDHSIEEKVQNYTNLFGRRGRRIYEIPKECLYGKTKRGGMTYYDTNLHELYDPDYIVENSKIIGTILENFDSYEEFIQDSDNLETFYTSYFPDDIPDEWSLECQKKSHGFGVNQKTDKPILRRYFTRWVNLKSNCQIWDKETIVSRSFEQLSHNFDDYYFEKKMFELYNNLSKKNDIWDMKNIKLILNFL
jgi:hypothetical protein